MTCTKMVITAQSKKEQVNTIVSWEEPPDNTEILLISLITALSQ